jgi:drug/metabolite transporter (DMT)-like permease
VSHQKSAPNLALGALLTMLAALCFAGMDAVSKYLVADYTVAQMLWIRYLMLLPFACFIVRRPGVRASLRSKRPVVQTVRTLIWVVESAIFVVVFRYLPLADTHALAATAPLLVIVMGIVFLGERASIARWIAVGAAFAGVLLIVRPGFKVFDWPLLIPLAGAILWALYQVLTRLVSRNETPETSMIWSALVAFIVVTPFAPFGWQWPTAWAWTLMLSVAAIGAVAHFALIKALDYAEAGAVQPYSYTLLVFATLFGVVFFGDVPDAWTIVGAGVVVASGLYAWHHDRRDEKRRVATAATP